MESGKLERALGQYSGLIEENSNVDEVIGDLKNAIENTPNEPMLWQTLGDALMKAGQLSDAIDAYRRGMEAV
jgi:cytochrome c-type biogenesis protein CcmH/NrfG